MNAGGRSVWRSVAAVLPVAVVSLFAAPACSPGSAGAPAPARTYDAVAPLLTRDLTPTLARRRRGAPAVETGSGLMIYGYRLDDGRTLWLGFPGERPILYAQLEEPEGSRRVLPLR
jgi:hypothetical protein